MSTEKKTTKTQVPAKLKGRKSKEFPRIAEALAKPLGEPAAPTKASDEPADVSVEEGETKARGKSKAEKPKKVSAVDAAARLLGEAEPTRIARISPRRPHAAASSRWATLGLPRLPDPAEANVANRRLGAAHRNPEPGMSLGKLEAEISRILPCMPVRLSLPTLVRPMCWTQGLEQLPVGCSLSVGVPQPV
jgi:hypothetical protein